MDCCHENNQEVTKKTKKEVGGIYTCPMHPEVIQPNPGMCPECGMALVPSKRKAQEHDKHTGHSTNIFKKKFWWSLILTIPIILYSELAKEVLGINAPPFVGSNLIGPVLGSVVFFYGGWVFVKSAWVEIKGRLPGMMTLISIAIITAYVYSMVVMIFNLGNETLFWELASLITIMLLGHWLEMRAVKGARGALKELSRLLPDSAEVIKDGKTVTVSIDELALGDIVLIRPGGKVPADGTIIEGSSSLNEAVITGESKPVEKTKDDSVIAGTINGDGSLKIRINKVGDDTFLSGVARLIADAQASKSRLQILSDRAAFYLTIVALTAGALAFGSWLFVGAGIAVAVTRMVAVLVIACPHALGLAVPLIASISTTKAAQNGFLVKQRLSLEAARNIDVVLFDKTGTLTRGEFGVEKIVPVVGGGELSVLEIATALNSHSEHPLAKAMQKEALSKGISIKDVEEFERVPGKGVRGKVGGQGVALGNEALLEEFGVSLPESHSRKVETLSSQGKTVVHLVVERELVGSLALGDIIREESREAIKALNKVGVKTAMITGDSEDVAKWVAKELNIDQYFANVLPHEKSNKVKQLQNEGQKVAMVGDGVNDAPALAQADLGIAIGAGTNVAIESAGIILVKDDPRDIPKIIKLSESTYRKMVQNLWWAAGYNIVAIPLAAGTMVWAGIVLEPAVGAILMSGSTVIVAFNALLFRRQVL